MDSGIKCAMINVSLSTLTAHRECRFNNPPWHKVIPPKPPKCASYDAEYTLVIVTISYTLLQTVTVFYVIIRVFRVS